MMEILWEKIQEKLKEKIDEQSYELWLSSLRAVELNDDTMVIEAPNTFSSDWFKKNCKEIAEDVAEKLTGRKISFEFRYNFSSKSSETELAEDIFPKKIPSFKTQYTFENFVVGPNNRFAYNVACAVAESPGERYNPVFIYGGVGVGKTHLLNAIANRMCELHKNISVLCISPGEFMREYTEALNKKTTQEFRDKFNRVDCLLLDDVQYFIDRAGSQEEFFLVFNKFYDSRKQIVITSDRTASELSPGIQDRLITRFQWGVNADIGEPDFETRVAILKKKAEINRYDIPDDVIYFIAENIKKDVRKLEGALASLIAYSSFEKGLITIDLAKKTLKDFIVEEDDEKKVLQKILEVISKHFNVSINELKSERRVRRISHPRQIGMYLTKILTDLSTIEIGQTFGGKDHSAVSHTVKKIKSKIESDPNFSSFINNLIKEIQK